jgi:hypothetical protein
LELASGGFSDGRFVLFNAQASNLGRNEDGGPQVYLRDRVRGTTQRVNIAPGWLPPQNDGDHGVDVSADGHWVTWQWNYSGTTILFITDVWKRRTSLVGAGENTPLRALGGGRMARNGRLVFFANHKRLVVWHRRGHTREVIPLPAAADQAYADDISADGRYLLFTLVRVIGSNPNGPIVRSEVYRRDRLTDTTTRVTVGPAPFTIETVEGKGISDNGRYIAFASPSGAFTTGDTDGKPDILSAT